MLRKFLLFVAVAGLALAAQAEPAAVITHLTGTLSVKHADGTSKLLSVNSEVAQGDLLATEAGTYARIRFTDGGEVVLRPGTQIKVESYAFNQAKPESDNFLISMIKGGLRAVTGLIGKRDREKVKIGTAVATIGVRGTHWGMLLCQDDCAAIPTVTGKPPKNGLYTDVAEGAIYMRNAGGEQQVDAGQFGYAADGQTKPQLVPPQEGIQVTMPQSVALDKGSGEGIGGDLQCQCEM